MITVFLLAYTDKMESWEPSTTLSVFAFELVIEVGVAVTTIGYFASQGA